MRSRIILGRPDWHKGYQLVQTERMMERGYRLLVRLNDRLEEERPWLTVKDLASLEDQREYLYRYRHIATWAEDMLARFDRLNEQKEVCLVRAAHNR